MPKNVMKDFTEKLNHISGDSVNSTFSKIEDLLRKLDAHFANYFNFLKLFDSMIDDYTDPINVNNARNAIIKIINTEADNISPEF